MTMRRTLSFMVALVISLAAVGPARARTDLIETTWVAESEKCAIRQVKFFDFDRALVSANAIGSDEASWKQDNDMVHVYFDHWPGKLDGPIDDLEFKAVYTWQSEETLEQTSMPCSFRRKTSTTP
jgi:hypothetical protein